MGKSGDHQQFHCVLSQSSLKQDDAHQVSVLVPEVQALVSEEADCRVEDTQE